MATSKDLTPTSTPLAKPSTTPLTDAVALANSQVTTFKFGNGDQIDTTTGAQTDVNGNPINPIVGASATANTELNQSQSSTFDTVNATPDTSVEDTRNQANALINQAQADSDKVQGELNDATTGDNDLRVQAQNQYDKLGIAGLQDEVAQAQQDYDAVRAQQLDNKSQVEDQYQGGGTERFAGNLDDKQQRTLALQQLAASTKLQVSQQRLSSQIDVFKAFNAAASDQQTHTISELSTQLGLDKQDLSQGVALLNQARQEAHGDDVAARQLVATFATQVPGLFQQLTPADQQNLTQGKITPTILAEVGKLTLAEQTKLDISQQNANTATSRAFGIAVGLDAQGIATGTPTEQATVDQQRLDISRARLQVAMNNAAGGGYIDSQATSQDLANNAKSLAQIPPPLQGYFQEKRAADGSTYVVPKVAKNQNAAFAKAYSDYWKANTSASYVPNVTPANDYVFDVPTVTTLVSKKLTAGEGYQQVRADAQDAGIPLSVYTSALKNVIAQNK